MGKMVENMGFCVPRLVKMGDKKGDPRGRVKNACITLHYLADFLDVL